MTPDEYRAHDATGLAALVAAGEVSPAEALEAAIAAVEATNPGLNAVVLRHDVQARAAVAEGLPAGPFRGVPFLLKDLDLSLAGTVTTHGSRLFAGAVARHDSTLVSRYKAAGLAIFGKTNSAELGLGLSTEPLAHGPTRHPRDARLSPGGSSGGAAAAVASGMAPMAHATDGGGSIRQPAALTGLFGLKPSRGRTPPGPDASEIFFGLSVSHALTRSVRDSAALLDATSGHEPGALHWLPEAALPFAEAARRDPAPLRVALQRRPLNGAAVDPRCLAAVEEAARLCRDFGHAVEEDAPDLDGPGLAAAVAFLAAAFTADRVLAFAREAGIADPLARLEPENAEAVRAATARPAEDVVAALAAVRAAERRLAAFFARHDLLLSPALATATLPLGHFAGPLAERAARAAAHCPFAMPCNAAGLPAMSLPFGDAAGPVGVQVAAALGREDRLFALAGAVERARPWGPPGGGAAFPGDRRPGDRGMASGGSSPSESRP